MSNNSPRGSDWEKDGVGISEEGHVILRLKDGPESLCFACSKEHLAHALEREREMNEEIEKLKRQLNAANPDSFLPLVITELEKRGVDAAALRCDGIAGKVMWGQAQAYRDAAAHIKSFIF